MNAPINERYVSELKKLLKILTTSGKLEEALKVKNEITRFEKNDPNAATPKKAKAFSKEYLVGTEWKVQQEKFVILKFGANRFEVINKDNDGNLISGGFRDWSIVSIKKRQIKIPWFDGEIVATLNRKFNEMADSQRVLKLIEKEKN